MVLADVGSRCVVFMRRLFVTQDDLQFLAELKQTCRMTEMLLLYL